MDSCAMGIRADGPRRIWNLCVLLFFGALVVVFVANDGANTVTSLAANNSTANRMAAVNQSARSASSCCSGCC